MLPGGDWIGVAQMRAKSVTAAPTGTRYLRRITATDVLPPWQPKEITSGVLPTCHPEKITSDVLPTCHPEKKIPQTCYHRANRKKITSDVLPPCHPEKNYLRRVTTVPTGKKYLRRVTAVPTGKNYLRRVIDMPSEKKYLRRVSTVPTGKKLPQTRKFNSDALPLCHPADASEFST